MHPVFQEMLTMAMAKLAESLAQETREVTLGEWDPDPWEQEVRQFTRKLGQQCLQTWALVKAQQAQEEARFCPCGQRRQIHELKPFWWLSTFGPIPLEVPRLRCTQGQGRDRPFQRLTGLRCRDKSLALQRALSDFGAEKSFAQASRQLLEHYGVTLDRSSVRQVVEQQAQRAEAFVDSQHEEVIKGEGRRQRRLGGQPWLIVESDGSMVRTGELVPDPEGGVSPQKQLPKKCRQTHWREVRLSVVQALGAEERQYGAVLGSPPKGGRADVGPGHRGGLWREHPGTWGRRWRPLDCPADRRSVSQAAISPGPLSPVRTPLCWSYRVAPGW
jgi:hypothetical protein